MQASIIAAGKDMTTYALGCGIDAGLTCEAMFAGQTLTRGPSTAAYIFTYGGEEYKSLGVGLDLYVPHSTMDPDDCTEKAD